MLPLVFALWPGFADDVVVQGARPAPEVRAALAAIGPQLAGCVQPHAPRGAQVFIDLQILAAGFLDRAAFFASDDPKSVVLSERCVRKALQELRLQERGVEPPTHAIVRLVVSADGKAPPAGTGPAYVADALDVHIDEIEACVDAARREEPSLGGSVIARLTVDGRGVVSAVDVTGGSLPSVVARACIAGELGSARFSGGRDDAVEVAWPMFFAPPAMSSPVRPSAAAWNAPTLFQFLGCSGAFPTS